MLTRAVIKPRLTALQAAQVRAAERGHEAERIAYGGVAALEYAIETLRQYEATVAEAQLWYIVAKALRRMRRAAETDERVEFEHHLSYAQELSWVLEMSEGERKRALEFTNNAPHGYATLRHYVRGDYAGEKRFCPDCGAPVLSLEPYCGLCGHVLIAPRQ